MIAPVQLQCIIPIQFWPSPELETLHLMHNRATTLSYLSYFVLLFSFDKKNRPKIYVSGGDINSNKCEGTTSI